MSLPRLYVHHQKRMADDRRERLMAKGLRTIEWGECTWAHASDHEQAVKRAYAKGYCSHRRQQNCEIEETP